MTSNEELLSKTLTTASFFAGGRLNPEQQARYVQIIREHGGFLREVSMVRTQNGRMDIDKVHVGEPITEAAGENDSSVTYHKPKFNKVEIDVTKLRAAFYATTEVLQTNLEQSRFEDTLINMMAVRHAMDIELLAIQGDSSIDLATDGDSPMNRLLRVKDGWALQTEQSVVVDAGSSTINKDIFSIAFDSMPRHFRRNTSGLRWIMNSTLWNDYLNTLSDRPTALGDGILSGGDARLAPLGIPVLPVNTIPDFLSLPTVAATAATIVGLRADPFEITSGVNDRMEINVDNAGVVVVSLPEGVHSAERIAYIINSTSGLAGVASTDVDGHVILTSPTLGAASEVELVITTHTTRSSGAYLTLGLVPNSTPAVSYPVTVNGADAGDGDTTANGTFMWLADPKQFLWAILDKTRVYAEYDKEYDRIETVVYDHMDFKVQNLEAIVKVKNLKRKF